MKLDLAIHAEYTSTPRVVEDMAGIAKETGLNVHLHLSETKAEQEACKQRHGGKTPARYFCDAGVFDARTTAAHGVWLEGEDFDVLIHNAGAYSIPRCLCDTGYDNVFQINFVSPYYMTCRLLPRLRERGGRVVAVGSIAHNYSVTDADDVDFRTRKKASLVYGNAKRYLMYALHELFRDEREATLAVAHPGITFTNITAHYPPLLFALIKHPMKVIFMSPRRAALSIVRGVFEMSPYRTWIGPVLLDVWGLPRVKKLRTAKDEEIERIDRVAREIYRALSEK